MTGALHPGPPRAAAARPRRAHRRLSRPRSRPAAALPRRSETPRGGQAGVCALAAAPSPVPTVPPPRPPPWAAAPLFRPAGPRFRPGAWGDTFDHGPRERPVPGLPAGGRLARGQGQDVATAACRVLTDRPAPAGPLPPGPLGRPKDSGPGKGRRAAQEAGPPARGAGAGHAPRPGGRGLSAPEGTSARHSPMAVLACPPPGAPLRTPASELLWTVQCGVVWRPVSAPHSHPGSLDTFPSRKTGRGHQGPCQGHMVTGPGPVLPFEAGVGGGGVGRGAVGAAVPLGTGGLRSGEDRRWGCSGRPSTGLRPGAQGGPLSSLAKEPRDSPPHRPAPRPRARLRGGETEAGRAGGC